MRDEKLLKIKLPESQSPLPLLDQLHVQRLVDLVILTVDN
jgi:hypothetical protein